MSRIQSFKARQNHGAKLYRVLLVRNRILFVIPGLYLCKSVYDGRGRNLEHHL